ncbi:hypothetical protein OT109_14630 [Phycisphaeraceae bacterium D3-23]
MSDSATQRVNCPGCGKGYRWDLGLVGQAVNCRKCGVNFAVPGQPGSVGDLLDAPPADDGTYQLDLEAGAEHPDEPEPLATPANDGKCPSCNSPISESAVICLNCGLNLREGTVLKPTVSELTVAERKEGRVPLNKMKKVRIGMWLQLLAVLLIIAMVASPIVLFTLGDKAFQVLLNVLLYGAGISALTGSVLCLAAPKESGGRPFLVASIILNVGSIVVDFAMSIGTLQEITVSLLSIAGTICFLLFFVQLARFLEFPEITERSEKLVGAYVILLIFSVCAPFVGCIGGILVLITYIYAVVVYIMLLLDLHNALTYRIAEQDD